MPRRSRSRSRMELSQRCACGKWFWTEQAHREHVASHECPLYERYLAAPVRVHCLLPEPPLPPPRRASASSHTSVPSPPRETGAPSGSSRCCEEPPWRRLKSNPPTPKLGPHEIAIGASVPLIDKWICYSCPNHIAPVTSQWISTNNMTISIQLKHMRQWRIMAFFRELFGRASGMSGSCLLLARFR